MKLTKGDLIAIEEGINAIRGNDKLDVRVAYALAKNLTLVGEELKAIREPIVEFEKANRASLTKKIDDQTDEDKAVLEKRLDLIDKVNETLMDEIEIGLKTINLDDLPEQGISVFALQRLDKIIKG